MAYVIDTWPRLNTASGSDPATGDAESTSGTVRVPAGAVGSLVTNDADPVMASDAKSNAAYPLANRPT